MLHTKFQFIWLRGFQMRRLKYEKLTDNRRRTPSDGKRSRCLWQGELKKSIFFILVTSEIFMRSGIHSQRLNFVYNVYLLI